jgi:class 3 adenylate cyclase
MPYVFGDYTLDVERRELRCRGHTVPLRPQVFDLLVYLVTHHDRAVTKQELLTALWPNLHVSPATLSACIKLARQAVGDSGAAQRMIQTLHGRGYRFVARVAEGEQRPLAGHPPPALPLAAQAQGVTPSALSAPMEPLATAAFSAPPLPTPDAEYKLVTVLCCELVDAPTVVTYQGPEALYRLQQALFGLAHEVMQHYTGTLMPPTSEGMTAVFGMPVAQEDHARRAVLAALELHQRLGQHPALREQRSGGGHAVRMGLHSGMVVVGGLGQDPQQLPTTVGLPVHLARRLQQQAAPGTILLSAATYALVHAEVQATPCGTLDMDGSPTSTLTYIVQGLLRRDAGVAGRRPRSRSPFVGRERERTFLHDCLARAAAGHGQVVGLVGEPGIGKSRLLTEFCQGLAGQPVTVYVGQCLAYRQATAYLPVRDVLRQFCGIGESDEPVAHTTAVQYRLRESGLTAAQDVALMCHILDLPVAPERLATLSPQAQLFSALFGLYSFANVRAQYHTAREWGEQLLALATRQQDPALLVQAHRALGDTLYWLGEFASARTHLERGLACYDRRLHDSQVVLYGEDAGVICVSFLGYVCWFLGYSDQALQHINDALMRRAGPDSINGKLKPCADSKSLRTCKSSTAFSPWDRPMGRSRPLF